MEVSKPPASGEITGRHVNQEPDNMVLMSSKPLHRFIQREPKSLGIVLVVFGCAELLMGFHLTSETFPTSSDLYIPFWQGALFFISGSLSIYTTDRPSKKMVTVSLSMYLVSFFGFIVSFGYRIHIFVSSAFFRYRLWMDDSASYEIFLAVEAILFTSSLCVAVLLIFLTCVSRLALKSTNTQLVVQFVPAQTAPPRLQGEISFSK